MIDSAGNNVKVVITATIMPRHIIQPKSITGRIPLTINDAKATIVVKAV